MQYNQEKILRELTEAVKESDSLVKLSRLVSSKIPRLESQDELLRRIDEAARRLGIATRGPRPRTYADERT